MLRPKFLKELPKPTHGQIDIAAKMEDNTITDKGRPIANRRLLSVAGQWLV